MKLEVTIPDNLSEITLQQYQHFLKIEGDDDTRAKKMLEIFCGLTPAQVAALKYNHIDYVTELIVKMFEQKPELTMRWTYENVEYGFIPNLEDISLGEYSDLDNLMRDYNTMHQAMAVLFRPIQHKHKFLYGIEPYESSAKYADVMLNMPMNVCFGAVLFMYRLGTELCKHSLLSLEEEIASLTTPQSQASLNDGVGTQSFMNLQKAMRSGMNQLRDLMYSLPSITPNLNTRSMNSKVHNLKS